MKTSWFKGLAAAALCCAAVAVHADEATIPLKFGFNPLTVIRTDSGFDNLEITSIKPVGEDVSGKIFIVKVDASGAPAATFQWLDSGEGPRWVDSNLDPVESEIFAPAQGFIVQCNCADGTASLKMTGESETIAESDWQVELQSGSTQVANPYSQTVDLTSIVAEGEEVVNNVHVIIRDSQGKVTVSYFWSDWVAEEPCWANDYYEPVSKGTVTLDPGVGFSVEGTSELQSIVFTAPL